MLLCVLQHVIRNIEMKISCIIYGINGKDIISYEFRPKVKRKIKKDFNIPFVLIDDCIMGIKVYFKAIITFNICFLVSRLQPWISCRIACSMAESGSLYSSERI